MTGEGHGDGGKGGAEKRMVMFGVGIRGKGWDSGWVKDLWKGINTF